MKVFMTLWREYCSQNNGWEIIVDYPEGTVPTGKPECPCAKQVRESINRRSLDTQQAPTYIPHGTIIELLSKSQ